MIKKIVINLIEFTVLLLSKTSAGSYVFEKIIDSVMNRESVIRHKTNKFIFSVPNRLNRYRIATFATKEPETLEWLDSIPEGSIVWDVGANVGLYSIYAAKVRKCKVYAFEPSVFNLELLARNIFLNDLQHQITIIPIALNDELGTNMFQMSTTVWGGALSTFEKGFDQDGAAFKDVFEYQTIGISLSETCDHLGIPKPDYIKIDVDGIEHFILRGASKVLIKVKGVMVEINDEFVEQAEESTRLLGNAGLNLHRKCDLGGTSQFNQWWSRNVD